MAELIVDYFMVDTPSTLRATLYFGSFLTCLTLLLLRWPYRRSLSLLLNGKIHVLFAIVGLVVTAAVGFYVTWSLIFSFFREENNLSSEYAHNAFIKAYVLVTNTRAGWMWSAQLLMWVIPGCLYLQEQSIKEQIGGGGFQLPWLDAVCYTVVGFMGAISLSFPLLFAHILVLEHTTSPTSLRSDRDTNEEEPCLSNLQLICSFIAIACVSILPAAVDRNPLSPQNSVYTTALIVLHIVLALPSIHALVWKPDMNHNHKEHIRAWLRIGYRSAYWMTAAACVTNHLGNVATAWLELDQKKWDLGNGDMTVQSIMVAIKSLFLSGFTTNVCQSSISFDVVFTAFAFSIFSSARRFMWGSGSYFNRVGWGITILLLTPFLSIGAISGATLAMYPRCRTEVKDELDKEKVK